MTNNNKNSWRDSRTTAQRGYGSRWQKARLTFLKKNPLCAYCFKNNLYTEATVVDHIDPHKGDSKKFWDKKNWQSLCKRCHDSTKQIEEKNKNGFDANGMPTDPDHPWNR